MAKKMGQSYKNESELQRSESQHNVSHLEKCVTVWKMCHNQGNGSQLEKWVRLRKMCQS